MVEAFLKWLDEYYPVELWIRRQQGFNALLLHGWERVGFKHSMSSTMRGHASGRVQDTAEKAILALIEDISGGVLIVPGEYDHPNLLPEHWSGRVEVPNFVLKHIKAKGTS